MRAILSILIISSILASCGSDSKKELKKDSTSEVNQLKEMSSAELSKYFRKINGVSEMTSTRFQYKFGKIDDKGELYTKSLYDINGNLIDTSVYLNNEVVERSTFSYDKNENLIEQHYLSTDGKILRKVVQEYDERNNPTALFIYRNNDDLHYAQRWTYDSLNNVSSFAEYDSSGNMAFKELRVYTPENKIMKIQLVNADGNILGKEVREYDKDGNNTFYAKYDGMNQLIEYNIFDEHGKDNIVTKGRKFDKDSNLLFSYIVGLDENGNEILYEAFNPEEKLIVRFQSEFDKEGDQTNYKKEVEQGLIFEDKATYDSLGRILSFEKFTYGNSKLALSKYEFNDNGLLKSKTVFDRVDEPKGVILFEYKFVHKQEK